MYIHISNLNIGINKGKMTEDELQKKYIEYLQKRLLKMDDKMNEKKCSCGEK